MPQPNSIYKLLRGEYTLERELGRSNYGVVWRAVRLHDGLAVAIKAVNKSKVDQAAAQEKHRWVDAIEREIDFFGHLKPWESNNIVKLLDHGVVDSFPVMALELFPTDLSQHVNSLAAEQRAPSTTQALGWIRGLNHALGRLHAHGMRHLDLKPSNVLLDESRATAKLADFGTVKQSVTEQHSFVGSAGWQAPEQLLPEKQADGRLAFVTSAKTDYFLLGVMLYYTVVGKANVFGKSSRDAVGAAREYAGEQLANDMDSGKLRSLTDTERAAFVEKFDQRVAANAVTLDDDGTVHPLAARAASAASPAARAALELLEKLLAFNPKQRPANETEIENALKRIDSLMQSKAGQTVTESAYRTATPDAVTEISASATTHNKSKAPIRLAKGVFKELLESWGIAFDLVVTALEGWRKSRRDNKAGGKLKSPPTKIGTVGKLASTAKSLYANKHFRRVIGSVFVLLAAPLIAKGILIAYDRWLKPADDAATAPSKPTNPVATQPAPPEFTAMTARLGNAAKTYRFVKITTAEGSARWVQSEAMADTWRTDYCTQSQHSLCAEPATPENSQRLIVNLTQYLATKWAEPKLSVVTESELAALRIALPKVPVGQSHWVADRRGVVGSAPPSNSNAKQAKQDPAPNAQQLRFSFPLTSR